MIDYPHEQHIHCENGAIRNMLKFQGVYISEPLIFGIGSGITFKYLPFIKVETFGLTVARPKPMQISKNLSDALGFKLYYEKFLFKQRSMQRLDELLSQEIPVGLVINQFHLPFFPPEHRVNFNGHHIVVYGKEGNRYFISDTMNELPDGREILSREQLLRVRFAKSLLSPRGSLFYVKKIPQNMNLQKGVWIGIRKTCEDMLHHPFRFFGIKGLLLLSEDIRKWENKFTFQQKKANFRHLIRFFEEAGTGGSAFRYLYAQFLKEAAVITHEPALASLSISMVAIADIWQNCALQMLRYTKIRNPENNSITLLEISDLFVQIAKEEKILFQQLELLVQKHQAVFSFLPGFRP